MDEVRKRNVWVMKIFPSNVRWPIQYFLHKNLFHQHHFNRFRFTFNRTTIQSDRRFVQLKQLSMKTRKLNLRIVPRNKHDRSANRCVSFIPMENLSYEFKVTNSSSSKGFFSLSLWFRCDLFFLSYRKLSLPIFPIDDLKIKEKKTTHVPIICRCADDEKYWLSWLLTNICNDYVEENRWSNQRRIMGLRWNLVRHVSLKIDFEEQIVCTYNFSSYFDEMCDNSDL